ncbi:MAG: L-seryl-tRNA(Sec) selenium transferase, partial [Ktedonobacteraceae bacterium]
IASRANDWVTRLQAQGIPARTQRGESTIGGGSLPGETLPTTLLAIDAVHIGLSLDELAKRLRLRSIPIVTRILRDTLLLDPRTVLEGQDQDLLRGLEEEIKHNR